MRADVAAKGKARLPFLFLVSDWEQKEKNADACVGEQHRMHPEQWELQHSTFTFRQGLFNHPERSMTTGVTFH